jgi:HK97 family phage major capsid protein
MSDVPKKKGLSQDELIALIKDVAGSAIGEKIDGIMSKVTDQGNAITAISEARARRSAMDPKERKGLVVGGILAALALGKGDGDTAIKRAKEAKYDDDVIKALEASTGSAGGFLIEPEVSSDFIDLLTPRTVFRSMGVPTVTMDSGILQIPKLNASSSAYYVGENRDIPKSQPEFGQIQLSAKKLAVLVPMSNSLLRRGGSNVSSIVRNDALRSAALKEDVTFLRSAGGQFAPKGIRYWVPAAHVLPAGGGSTLADVTADMANLILLLEEANVPFSNPGWIFAPRTKMFLMTLRDGNGNYAFRDEMLRGSFWGMPFRSTTQIPRNLGGGTESEVYLVDFDDVIIGQTAALEVAMSTEASYRDENGDLQSAFSLDQTVMRMIMEHDLGVRHAESLAVLTEVTWAN